MSGPQKKKYKTFGAPPPNYVAGLGRGATGFTTRSDIGPAREAAPEPAAAAVGKKRPRDDDEEGADKPEDFSESNYDSFTGYGGSLFSAGSYDKEDEEADQIWGAVDDRMDQRRKERREATLKVELAKARSQRPKIQEQFADLRRGLATLTEAEWDSLPEVGSHTVKKESSRFEKYTPAPDSVMVGLGGGNASATIDPRFKKGLTGFETPIGPHSGLVTPLGTMTPMTDLRLMGEARTNAMSAVLRTASESVSGQTNVDPKSYMDGMKSIKVANDAEVGDIIKARMLLNSVCQTNKKHAPAWIARARLEEIAGKLVAARKIAYEGCDECPDSEDIWLEAARLHPPDMAKRILAQAIKHIPQSVKIWEQAAKLENDKVAKKRVLRKALENVPNSVRLWKTAVEMEEPEEARILLSRAVECIPDNVDLWLALARLESYDNARKVLNKARETLPTNLQIWITAAKLEEAHGNEDMIDKIIRKGVKSLAQRQVLIDRETWIKEAETAEKSGSPGTCQAIVRATIGMNVEDQDRLDTWMEDAEDSLSRGSTATARAILAHALTVFPGQKNLWMQAAQLEQKHGTRSSLDQLLQKAVTYCPQAEVLWLMGAKEKWKAGEIAEARAILAEANTHNPDSEQIWLAAFKLENANNQPERARVLLQRARQRCSTERVWMKSVQLEREQNNLDAARELVREACDKYPTFPKLWMQSGQIEEAVGNPDDAREIYKQGCVQCPHAVALWLCASRLEEKTGNVNKARSLLETARLRNLQNPVLWLEAVRVETRAGSVKAAEKALAKALQECPTSGMLWAEVIASAPRPQQRSKSVDALKHCDNDPYVIVAVAILFWQERKLPKARSWLQRAVKLNPDFGDAWAFLYKFEAQHGDEAALEDVKRRMLEADPHHGEEWVKVSKAVENSHLKPDEVMTRVALNLKDHF